jgi:flagellar assembly protein FliH
MSLDARVISARNAKNIDASRIEAYPYVLASAVPAIEEILPEAETDEPLGAAYEETHEEKQFRINSVDQIISEKFAKNEKAMAERLAEIEQIISEKIAAAEERVAQSEGRAAQSEGKAARAEEKVAQAEEKVAQAEQQAVETHRRAYEQGFLQGESEGREMGESRFRVHMAKLDESLASLSDAVSLHRSATDDEALALATVMAEYLAGQHIDSTAYTAGPLLRSLLDAHPFPLPDHVPPSEPTVVVYMHPKDFDQIRGSAPKDYPGTRILPDTGIGRGGLRLETADAVIDSTFERRRERLLRLIGRLKEEGRI